MSGDAERMNQELLQLIKGEIPETSEWMSEIPNGVDLPGSWNKPPVCNTADAYFAHRTDRPQIVTRRLDWWPQFAQKPLGGAEGLTPEEMYRTMPIYAAFASQALARKVGHSAAEAACARLARAHVGWLALGVAPGVGMGITDHHLDNLQKPCVLIGDGRPENPLQWVAQAGPRGFIRNRQEGPKKFLFTSTEGLSVVLYQAAGMETQRKRTQWQYDIFNATLAVGMHGVSRLGLSDTDQIVLRSFMANPTDVVLAREIIRWCSPLGCYPSHGYTFIRYVDGSIATYIHRSPSSSTDPRMIAVWYHGGKVAITSADDGLRASSEPQVAFETSTSICCQKLSGGVVMSVLKPSGEEAYRVVCENDTPKLVIGGVTPPIVTPSAPQPAAPVTVGGKKRRRFGFS